MGWLGMFWEKLTARCGKTAFRVVLIGAFTVACLLLWSYKALNSTHLSDVDAYIEKFSTKPGYLRRKKSCTKEDPCVFKIVADLDQQSRITSGSSLLFKSLLLEGSISEGTEGEEESGGGSRFTVQWKEPVEIYSKHNEAGRGMELSELVLSSTGQLYSADDRTGIVYEHLQDQGKDLVVPRHIITEGLGDTNKGMKIEWGTTKGDWTWFGSFGKEFTGPKGEIVNENNFWVAAIDSQGRAKRYDWKSVYDKIRRVLSASWPGYVIHEAVSWSPIHQLWVFLPRRVSSEPYDDEKDEKRGSDKMVLADERFSSFEVRTVGKLTPERGFSSFKFLPGSRDSIILALKSEEEASTGKQRTFITAFSLDGETYMEETEVPSPHKFEGLEFLQR